MPKRTIRAYSRTEAQKTIRSCSRTDEQNAGDSEWSFIKLLTWGGLRGGLSTALAMSTWDFLSPDTYYILLGCTYAIVFFTTVVQGLTVKKVYDGICRRLAKAS